MRDSLLCIRKPAGVGDTRKMAARWGVGEEILTACNMDFFPMDTLEEASGLNSEETLEVLQSCIDPSILSIFEDMPTIETKGLDDESEATLLTALTEILDNVDDENLSPFDTLPDSDLLSNQKVREQSPLRRLMCQSRSPPEKHSLCSSRPLSTGKTLPRIHPDSLQRSDGEEEDYNSLTPSPVRQDSSPDHNLLDWEGLTLPLPINFDQGAEDGLSVSLGDLVRQMHPYCMAICLENDDGQQMLPEGGILLEVVDQAENGDPILAIPDMGLPLTLPLKDESTKNEQKLSEASEVASDSSEHIVVDDDDDDEEDIVTATKSLVKVATSATPQLHSDANNEMINKKHKEMKEKIPSRRKKKKKCKEESQPQPEERRVLRSGTVRKMPQEAPIKQKEKRSVKEEKKPKLSKVSQATNVASSLENPKEQNRCQTKAQTGITTTRLLPDVNTQAATSVLPTHNKVPINTGPEKSQASCALQTLRPQKPVEPVAPASEKIEDSSAATLAVLPQLSSESPAAAPSPITPPMASPVAEALPSVAPAVPEPKPKSLSLAEYRRLRQQKKPAPVEKQDGNSTKWPSLQELPKELPPIPCLPDPGLKDRRPSTQTTKKEVEQVKPAWQPRGPAAPPTPEALLVPPAYMVASSNKVSAATTIPKPHQTPEPSKPNPIPNPPAPAPNAVDTLPLQQHTKCQPAVPTVPPNSASLVSLKPVIQLSSTADKSSPVLSIENGAISKSTGPTKTCLQTTAQVIKLIAATVSAPSAPQNTTVSQRVPEVTAATSLDNPVTSHSKSSKTTAGLIQHRSSAAAHLSESRSQKTKPVVLETKENCTTTLNSTKSPTQELIEAFTSEIGIEAADLTSLLEQFEETQAKEEQCVPEVSGKAAAVGNSSFESAPENTVVERVRANDLSSTAALTPPATPPHQMWKPLAPVALLGKSKAAETPKLSPSKAIQIEPRPLPYIRSRSKPTPASAPIAPEVACMDHDYCLPNMSSSTGEPGKRWNVKQQTFITIKPIKQTPAAITQTCPASLVPSAKVEPAVNTKTHFPPTVPLDHRTDRVERNSVLETPDASPTRKDTDSALKEESPRRGPSGRSYRRHAASHTPNLRSSPNRRTGARSRKRSHRSPSPLSSESESDSHSSRSRSRSRSHSPSKKRYRSRLSESSSTSSSRSSSRSSPSVSRSPPRRRRYSYSSSRSGSWSRSRSRSRSPDRRAEWSRNRRMYSPSYDPGYGQNGRIDGEESKQRKEKAIEERRVVYVGRIRGTMTQKELRERFSLFGKIEECTLHFRNHGDNYGFVTYYDTKDAFTAIENGSKLRKPDELPFDLCFGGRRQFCKSNYSDLDSSREYDPFPAKRKFNALDFDTLLKQAQQNMKR